jgi:hypothetical protein
MDSTTTTVLGAIVVAAAIAACVLSVVFATRHTRARRVELRTRFGPEYDRAVIQYGTHEKAERELARRARRVEHFRFREMGNQDRARFQAQWSSIQAQFVDDPHAAAARANVLIDDVMSARGYPSESFEERAADLSVFHAKVVEHYRAAHALAVPAGSRAATTEELRQALVHYRALFAELLEPATQAVQRALRHAHA